MSAEASRAHPIRSLIKRMPMYAALKQLGHYPDYWWWKLRGEPRRTPHIVKQRAVLQYAQMFGLTTLVETGTYYGEMITAVARRFQQIYSVEVEAALAKMAKDRFRKYEHVTIIEGDSQTVVPWLVNEMDEACLWWLDAGYCGWAGASGKSDRLGSEFEAILADSRHQHVILMDDADGVTGLQELIAKIQSDHPNRQVEIVNNIIRVMPRKADSSLLHPSAR
jgi:hypothetical protein